MGKKICNRADEMTFSALKKAIETNKISLCLVESKINRPNSPVYNPWEVLLPILVPVIVGLILIMAAGSIFGLVFMVAAIFITSNLVKKKLEQRLVERCTNFLLSSYSNCNKIWDFGGIVLVNNENKKKGCIAPDGDWKEFIIKNYSDLLIEKKDEIIVEEPKPEETQSEEPKDETPKHRRRSRRG